LDASAQLLEVLKRTKGEKDLETIHCITRMASIYAWQGALKKAEELKVEALSLCNEFLVEKHLVPLICKSGKLSTTVLSLHKESLGESYPVMLEIIRNFIYTYPRQDAFNEAEELATATLALGREFFGEKHPNTITAMRTLSATYCEQGRLREAEGISCRCSSFREGGARRKAS
jgi:Tetratricopeptide repeat